MAKTDRLDAEVLARFADQVRPEARAVQSEQAQMLAELVSRCRQLVEMIGMESNRRRQARGANVREGIERTLEMLRRELDAIDHQIDGEIKGSPAWWRRTC